MVIWPGLGKEAEPSKPKHAPTPFLSLLNYTTKAESTLLQINYWTKLRKLMVFIVRPTSSLNKESTVTKHTQKTLRKPFTKSDQKELTSET